MPDVHLSREYITSIVQPRALNEFKNRVKRALVSDSLRKIRHDTFVNAMWDRAWVPHLKFIDEFMRERCIDF